MKNIFIVLLLLFTNLYCFSQTGKQDKKFRFQSLNQIGFVYGEAGAEPIIQSINGIQHQSFFIGAGLGLDYYNERSLPLFMDIRKSILNKVNTPFIYIDGGYHLMLEKSKEEDWISKDQKGGLYYDAGIGYSFPVFKTSSLVISMGYSSKEQSEKMNRYTWRSSIAQPSDYETIEYTLRRYSFKMGLAF